MSFELFAPQISQVGEETQLSAEILLNGERKTLWFRVPREYGEYLTYERSDAFVAALISPALRAGQDILCHAPVSRKMLYQINRYFIPTLTGAAEDFHPMQVIAQPADDPLPCENAVGTGWTGGADSLYTVATHLDRPDEMALTHLTVFNCGTFEGGGSRNTFHRAVESARGIAGEMGLKLLSVDSNLHEVLQEHYLSVFAFRLSACALAVSKLFSHYLLSSSYSFPSFGIAPNNTGYYDLLTCRCLSPKPLYLVPIGGELRRIDKLEILADFEPAHRLLHPCVRATGKRNCGTCGKCVRTVTGLFALGKLDDFGEIFDLDAFYSQIDERMGDLLAGVPNEHCLEVARLLEAKNYTFSATAKRRAAIKKAVSKQIKETPGLTQRITAGTADSHPEAE